MLEKNESRPSKADLHADIRLIYKIVIVGKDNIGKSSIADKFLGEGFKQNYRQTVGMDWSIKKMKIYDREITFQLWILRGQDRFKAVRETYYLGSTACILIFDVTNRDTFDSIPRFANELMNNSGGLVPIMLVGNKIDLRNHNDDNISYEEGLAYAKELSNWLTLEVPYAETSIKDIESGKSIEKFLGLFFEYWELLNEFGSNERLKMLLAQTLYKDVTKFKQKNQV